MTSPKPQSLSKIQLPSAYVPIVLWSRRVSASLLSPIGLGLVSLGLLSGPVVQAQTTGTDIKLLEPSGLAAVQALSPTESPKPTATPSVSPPEILQSEVEPMPPVATVKPSAMPSAKPESKAPESIIFSDRASGCDTSVAWGSAVGSLCQAKPTVAKIQTPTKSVAAPESIAAEASDLAPESEPSVARLGPITVDRQGIQFSPPDVLKPYFNGNLKLPKMPSLSSLGLMFPLAIPSPITSLFGWRTHPISGDQRMHTGTDIAAPLGTPVVAALTGKVLLADFLGGYGMAVALEHGQGSQQTLYAHLSELFVRPGQVVEKGTVIGRVGTTGNSTGPHLHFELRQQLPDGSWIAQDAGLQIEVALKDLSQSLKVAKFPQTQPVSLQAQQIAQAPQMAQQMQPTSPSLPLKAESTIVKASQKTNIKQLKVPVKMSVMVQSKQMKTGQTP